MTHSLWLLVGAIGSGVTALAAATESKQQRFPESNQTDGDGDGGKIEADYEIVEDGTGGEIEPPKRTTTHHRAVIQGAGRHATESVEETLIREAVRHRDEWQTKFTFEELRKIESGSPDVENLIERVEQSRPVGENMPKRLQDLHQEVSRYHSGGVPSSIKLHCPFCRRETKPWKWYCSYCGREHSGDHDLPIRRCDCGKKATTLICKHCYVPVPLRSRTGKIEWDMPAVPEEVTAPGVDEVEKEQKLSDIERDHRIEEFTSEVQTFLKFRRELESLRTEEEERLADEYGQNSEEYQKGLENVDRLLSSLESQFRDRVQDRKFDDNPSTEIL